MIICNHCGNSSQVLGSPVTEAPAETPGVIQGAKRSGRMKSPTGAIADLLGDSEVEHFLSQVPQSVQERWIKLYKNPQVIKREILQAINWMESKKVRKKDLGRFMSNWLKNNEPPENLTCATPGGIELMGEVSE
jgi:hypothetical protein